MITVGGDSVWLGPRARPLQWSCTNQAQSLGRRGGPTRTEARYVGEGRDVERAVVDEDYDKGGSGQMDGWGNE